MESGELSLEAALAHYREGVGLLRQCHGILAEFKRQVEELARDSEQGLKPYRGDPDAEADAGDPRAVRRRVEVVISAMAAANHTPSGVVPPKRGGRHADVHKRPHSPMNDA